MESNPLFLMGGHVMARTYRHLPVPQPTTQVVYVQDPALQADLERLTASEMQTRRAQQRAMYRMWQERQARIAEHDRKVRRFWLGFGAVFAFAFLLLVVVTAWWLWTAVGLGMFAIPLLFLGATVTAVGGHRCVTIVQHWH
jgi:Flp pilus assembly protein TadB